jgi:hypothetical protein
MIGEKAQRALEKCCELGLRHLARCHREFSMLDRTRAADVSIYAYVVRRIGEDHLRLGILEQPSERLGLGCVGAEQTMLAQQP